MLLYDWVASEFVNEHCTPLGPGNPSPWWRHPVIGDFPLRVLPGPPPEVADAEYAMIMNDLIKNRPP
jgi:hypothetical protein